MNFANLAIIGKSYPYFLLKDIKGWKARGLKVIPDGPTGARVIIDLQVSKN